MIDTKQIPPEVVEAAARAIYKHWQYRAIYGVVYVPPWVPGGNSTRQDQCRDFARASLADALNAWPGVARAYNYDDKAGWTALNDFNSQPTDGFILPLSKEPRND